MLLLRWSKYCAIFILAIGILVLAGWTWDIDFFKRPIPHLTAMNPLTALNFVCAAASFLLLTPNHPPPRSLPPAASSPAASSTFAASPFAASPTAGKSIIIGMILAGLVLLVGLLRMAGPLPGLYHSVDQLLFAHRLLADQPGNLPNQMTIQTAFCFILSGLSLLMLNRRTKSGHIPAQYIALLGAMMGLFSLIGYLYRVQAFYWPFTYVPMSVHTSACFLFLSIAIFLAQAGKGIMKELTGSNIGSVVGRSLLPLVILLPILLGYLRLLAYWKGLITTEFGVAVLVSSIILTFSVIIWFNARLLNRRDQLKQAAEKKLLESEERFRLIISSVKDYAIFMLDPSGQVVSWNEGAERIKGYKKEEIIGRNMSVFYTPDEIRRGEPHYNLLQAKKFGRFEQEGERVRKDGSLFWANVLFTALRDPNGKLLGFAKVTRDITERRQSEEQITYLARLMEDTTDAIFSTDTSFVIRTWNKAAELLFGYSLAEVKGQSAGEILRTQMNKDIIRSTQEKMLRDGYWKGEVYYLTKAGNLLTILLSASRVKNAYKQSDGIVLVCRDFTERKKMELQLQQFNNELEEQVKKKTAELSESYQDIRKLASHLLDVREEERASIAREIHDELGQQLTGLKMDISWITKKKGVLDEKELDQKTITILNLLDTTIKTVRRIATDLRPSILDDLGLVAAIEWQSQEFERRSGICTKFISSIEEFHHSSAIAIGLFRICQESLTNIARHAAASQICISLQEEENEYILLKIEDNGKGFEVRTIGEKKTLGLLGMKERTLMMGGEFRIGSEPGKGTTLFIKVPITIAK
jgi:PAS domain S-box-containing protein